jgi:hypothetical protein
MDDPNGLLPIVYLFQEYYPSAFFLPEPFFGHPHGFIGG